MDRPPFRRPPRRLRPTVDSLERKALLSGAADAGAVDQAAYVTTAATTTDVPTITVATTTADTTTTADRPTTISAPAANRIELDGSIRGTLRSWKGATTGAESRYFVNGKGRHATIGVARAEGFAMPASVESLPSATLTLKTRRDSITLVLQALPETSARPARAYRYTVLSGAGAYLDATGSGTATLALPRGLPRGAGAAPFTLLLQSDHVRH